MTDMFYKTLSVGCLLGLGSMGCEGEQPNADGNGAAGGADSSGGAGGSTSGDGGNSNTEDRSALYGDDELVGSCLAFPPRLAKCEEYLSYDPPASDSETWAYNACKGIGTEDTWVEENWQSGVPCRAGAEAACRFLIKITYTYPDHEETVEARKENCELNEGEFFIF